MIASFILSRTLVPTMAMYLLKPHARGAITHSTQGNHMLARLQRASRAASPTSREGYRNLLALAMTGAGCSSSASWRRSLVSFAAGALPGLELLPHRRYRPDHAACAPARRHPDRGHHPASSPRSRPRSARVIPRGELATIVDNIGLPPSSINMIYNNSGLIGAQDGDIFISLNEGHRPTADYVRTLREGCRAIFPASTFSFPPADIVSQILNFGAPAPHRRAGHRHQPRRDRGLRHSAAAPDARHSRHRRRPHAAVQRLPAAQFQRRPRPHGAVSA